MEKKHDNFGKNSLAHLKGEKEITVKRQHPFRYTEKLDKEFKAIYRLQYPPRIRNSVLIHAIKIASAYLKKIDPNQKLEPDTLKDILKEKLGLDGEDLN